jgi:hypothetical protein
MGTRLFVVMNMHECGIRIAIYDASEETNTCGKGGSRYIKRHNMGMIYAKSLSD